MPVTITDIETQLQLIWSGKLVTTLDKGAVIAPVFVDVPDPEENTERVYPSIQIEFEDMIDEEVQWDTEDEVKISEDTGGFPFVSTVRRNSHWYRIVFSIHTWALDAPADRELIRWIDSRKEPKDAIDVGGQLFWMFRTGFNKADESDQDRRIYHKVWTYYVVADIDDDDNDRTIEQVHSVIFTTGLVETLTRGGVAAPIDASNNQVEAKDAVFREHRKFSFDDLDFTILVP